MKAAAIAAVEASNPVNWLYGTVTKAKPLEIEVHAKLTLTEEFLDVSEHLTRHDRIVSVRYEYPKRWSESTVIGDTDKEAASTRNYIGSSEATAYEKYEMLNARMTFEDGLVIGDKVTLLRMQGGHRFLVVDRYKEGEEVWSYQSVK